MNPLQDGCGCPACDALRKEIGADAALVAMYGKKLLITGWAGQYSPAEKGYRLAHSRRSKAAAAAMLVNRQPNR